MLSDREQRELALLRGRAYGRGDAIGDGELARLRELEAHSNGRDESGDSPVADSDGPGSGQVDEVDSTGMSERGAASPAPRRRGLLPLAVGIAGLALGAGVASVVSSLVSTPGATVVTVDRDARLSPSAAEQLPEVARLGRWDEGSLAVLGGLDATTIWSATRAEGAETCVIVYSAAESRGLTVTCGDSASVAEDGITGVVFVYDDGGSSSVFGFRADPALDPGVVFRRQ